MNVENGLSEIDMVCINWVEVLHDRINMQHFVVNVMKFLSENTKFSVLITDESINFNLTALSWCFLLLYMILRCTVI
jgi:hypothetical protein